MNILLDCARHRAQNAPAMKVVVVAVALAATAATPACTDQAPAQTDDVDVAPDGAADVSDPSVRVADTTLSVSANLTRTGNRFTLRGKTSRSLTGGNGFIVDDVYGTFEQVSPRVFELSWSVSELRPLADGTDQLIGLDFVHSSGKPDALTGRVVVRPRLGSITGSSKIYLVAEVEPIVTDGDVAYRITGHTYDANTSVELRVNGDLVGNVTRSDDKAFTIDLPPAQAIALTNGADLDVIAALPTGGVEKHSKLGLAVKKLGMTSGDGETVYARPTCTTKMSTCLQKLTAIPGDTSSCGDAFNVLACRGTVGVLVDGASIAAAKADAVSRISSDDATGLVGTARAPQFVTTAQTSVGTALDGIGGRWYLTADARTAALTVAADRGIDGAYARPLALVPAAPVTPTDAAAMRQVAADAVLGELATMDLLHTEFGRTLDDLVHEFRAQHVASIRAFRETVFAEPYPGSTTNDVYVGEWLGTHVEVTIERATGKVLDTLVEID